MNNNSLLHNNNNSDNILNNKQKIFNLENLETSGEFMENYESIFYLAKENNINIPEKEMKSLFSNKYNKNLKTIDSNNSNILKEENSSNISYNKNFYNSQSVINKYEEKTDSDINGFDKITNGKNSINNDNLEFYKNNKLITNYKKWNGNNYFIFKGHMFEVLVVLDQLY